MTRSKLTLKTALYTVLTVLITVCAARWQGGMHGDAPERGFFLALFYGFVLACTLMGGAVYGYFAFVRRRRPHYRADILFLLLCGVVLMATVVGCFLRYGALSAPFGEEGVTAINFLSLMLSLLPLPFTVRVAVCALTRAEGTTRPSQERWLLLGMVATLYVVLLITGDLFQTAVYVPPVGGATV